MLYRVYYQSKTEKINISLPLTYEKLVTAISEQFGLPPEQQQLLVNNVQLTAETDLDKCKLPMYPIVVRKLTNINVVIGKVSFSTSFYFGYKCSVLCSFILDILSSYGFTIPQFDYCLDIDGKSVNMDSTVEEVGTIENSTVTLISRSGESLEQYFHLDDEEGEEEETVNTQTEEPALNQENEDLPEEVPVEEKPVEENEDLPEEVPVEEKPAEENEDLPEEVPVEEKPAEEKPTDNDLVTVHRRNGKDNKKATTPATSMNQQFEKPTELPTNVRALLSILRASDKGEEEKSKAVNEIEGILLNCQSNLYDNGVQLSVYDNMINEINYENQMLRDMYNTVNPQAPLTKEYEDKQKGSWQRAIRTEDDSIAVLPDDVDELKKLVNEKYATALMNERRYEKEHKRCKKWKLVAQSLGVNDDNVDAYATEFHGVMEHRDHLKDENLDLKGQIRQLNSEIDSRDDEIRRLMETVHSRDSTIEELVSKIEQYDALLKEGGQVMKENEDKVNMKEDMEEEKKKIEEEKKKMEKERKDFMDEKNSLEEVTKKIDEEYRKMEKSMKEIEEQQQRLTEEREEIEKEKRELEEKRQKQGKEDQSQIEEKEKRINELEATISELQEKVNSSLSTQQSELLTTENNELKKEISSMYEENEKQINEENEYIQQLTQILEMMNNGLKAKKERMKSLQEE